MIKDMNAKNIAAGKDLRHGHNKLSTWTKTERKHLTGYIPSKDSEPKTYESGTPSNSTGKDWREGDEAVTGVKDQGQCGSCWSFGAMGALEGAWKIAGNNLTSFAEQQLVDCAGIQEGWSNLGCNGGRADSAYAYLKQNYAMKTSDYAYFSGTTGKKGACKYDASKGVTKVPSFTNVTP